MPESQPTAPSDRARLRGPVPVWIPLLGATSVNILSTGLYTPSLPHLTRILATDAATVQLTMSLNLLAFSLAQLVDGPLADRFGRKRLLLIGLACFVVASLACAVAPTIATLLTGRIAQGAFASVSAVVVAVIIRECYDGARATQVMGLYGIALAGVPAVGPVIGGYVFVLIGWRANFFLLAGLAVVVFAAVAATVPETGGGQRGALNPVRVVVGYARLISDRRYMAHLMPLVGMFGALFAFVTAGPFVLIDRLGVPTEHYGFVVMVPLAAFMAGSFAANRLAGHVSIARQIWMAVAISLSGALLMLALVLMGYESITTIVVGTSLLEGGLGMLLAAGYIGLLDAAVGQSRGSASALAGSAQVASASLASFLVGALHDGSALPMAAMVALFATIGAVGWVTLTATRRAPRSTR